MGDKNFYSEEFDIGLYGLKLINDRFNISMPEDEAGFIALHIASIRTNDNIQQTYKSDPLYPKALLI